jgi:hypothetical protein
MVDAAALRRLRPVAVAPRRTRDSSVPKVRAVLTERPITGDIGRYRLVLEIEVPEFYVDNSTQEAADEWYRGKILPIVLDEWMREDVGLTFVSLPGEKEMNSDFEVHAMNGRIIGARIVETET